MALAPLLSSGFALGLVGSTADVCELVEHPILPRAHGQLADCGLTGGADLLTHTARLCQRGRLRVTDSESLPPPGRKKDREIPLVSCAIAHLLFLCKKKKKKVCNFLLRGSDYFHTQEK